MRNCAKIHLSYKTTTALVTLRPEEYIWLAPDVGPIRFQDRNEIVYDLVSFNLITTENPYDVNTDGVINILDLVFVAAHFGGTDPKADVNDDGTVNILDLTLVAQNFGN